MSVIRTAVLQHAMQADMDLNADTGVRMIAEAGEAGVQLGVFPEVQLSPFFAKHKGGDASAWAIDLHHPILKRFCDAARAARMVVVANIYLEDEGKRYDASPVFDADGRLLGVSKMVHIAQFDGFWERDYYTPGSRFAVYDTAIGKLGVVICYDRHFPESYRACALAGAEFIATPTCVERDEPHDLFEAELRTLSYHNSIYALFANRCGDEDGRSYAGRSAIYGPQGDQLARAGDEACVLMADCDKEFRQRVAQSMDFLGQLKKGPFGKP
ncbi:carbon-nitrogen hydrolase family protein [Woodsholea maritima]|uniref:carbon-nitrogen hydrolase family protein n=1 Tax=Woodsholea maritima TaxID=240237 RepID=UPI00035C5E89|nr:carbon-nitrogen hydrolase family protein [Woodsholea maritima]